MSGSGDPAQQPEPAPEVPASPEVAEALPAGGSVALPRVPRVAPEAGPRTRDGRPVRSEAPLPVSPLRAVAGAALAVAGVALGIGALLSVTQAPGGSPVLSEQDARAAAAPVEATPAEPEVLAPVPGAPAQVPGASAPTAAAPVTTTAPPAPAPTVPPTEAAPRAAAPPPAVTVLNNSTRTGLADRAASRFVRSGWPVRHVGNFRGRLRATTVYYEPGQRAAAQRFAGTFRGITRVLPRASNIPGPRGLVVVLTRDFPA